MKRIPKPLYKLLGTHGQMQDGTWCFGGYRFIDYLPFRLAKFWYKVWFHIGSPALNLIFRDKTLNRT